MESQIKQLEKRIAELEKNKIGVIMTDNSDMNVLRSVQRSLINNPISIGISNPTKSALLELSSITKGLVLSRMTTTQRDAIVNPIAGLIIFNTSTNKLNFYTGAAWAVVTSV